MRRFLQLTCTNVSAPPLPPLLSTPLSKRTILPVINSSMGDDGHPLVLITQALLFAALNTAKNHRDI